MNQNIQSWIDETSRLHSSDILLAIERIEPDDDFPAKITGLIENVKKGDTDFGSWTQLNSDLLIEAFRHNFNFEFIGNGAYAFCIHSNQGLTYKINIVSDLEDAWGAFAETSMLHDNPLLPKCKSIYYSGSTYCAVVEKLDILEHEMSNDIYEDIDNIIYYILHDNENELFDILNKYSDCLKPNDCKNLIHVLNESIQIFKIVSGSAMFDFKPDNFMMRGNQIVINDPLA